MESLSVAERTNKPIKLPAAALAITIKRIPAKVLIEENKSTSTATAKATPIRSPKKPPTFVLILDFCACTWAKWVSAVASLYLC